MHLSIVVRASGLCRVELRLGRITEGGGGFFCINMELNWRRILSSIAWNILFVLSLSYLSYLSYLLHISYTVNVITA
jgi:hypothetical protein